MLSRARVRFLIFPLLGAPHGRPPITITKCTMTLRKAVKWAHNVP